MDSSMYEAPAIRIIGTVHDMTQQSLEKCGNSLDALSILMPNLEGTIRPGEECVAPDEPPEGE